MEPVDPDEAPDYYRVIKDPMGNFQCFFFFFVTFLSMKRFHY